jgi:rSAM/selenodomain-associated transferase 2
LFNVTGRREFAEFSQDDGSFRYDTQGGDVQATATYVSAREDRMVNQSRDHAFVSIIVPTLNEAANICRLAQALNRLPGAEVIFVDGGSRDGTVQEIKNQCIGDGKIRLVHSASGRGRQMNAGARLARGDWLIFLHADTFLPPPSFQDFLRFVRSQQQLIAGAFTFRVDHPRWVYRYLEFYVAMRSRLLRLPYGDQAIFVNRKVFEELGGYRDDYPLMEDVELVRRLNKHQGFAILKFPVYTSARRFERDGYLRRTCGNLYLQCLYACGVPPQKLAEKYWKQPAKQF